jgi:hypothetical protein
MVRNSPENMSDYVFFEHAAIIHLTGNPSASGAAIHCLAKMRANNSEGKPISIEDLKTRADDIIAMAISLGPERMLSNSKIWQVDEDRSRNSGMPLSQNTMRKAQSIVTRINNALPRTTCSGYRDRHCGDDCSIRLSIYAGRGTSVCWHRNTIGRSLFIRPLDRNREIDALGWPTNARGVGCRPYRLLLANLKQLLFVR